MDKIPDKIRNKKRLYRYSLLLLSLIISALVYNIFLLPLNIVTGGTGGIATITKYLYDINPSIMILILSLACAIISLMYLGKEITICALVSSVIYPVLVTITAPIAKLLPIDTSDMFIIIIFAGVLSGIASGLMYKTGYNTGGLAIISQILYKNFKIPVSTTGLIMNLVIVIVGGVYFGPANAMYACILLYISNLVLDKVLLGISNNKAFYIITSKQEEIKEYVMEELKHSVTVFDVKGGFLEKKKNVLLTVIPTREYYKVTDKIKQIDEKAFFVVTDSYEVANGK